MIHTGWHPEGSVADVGVLAKRNADVNFVIAHMKEEWGVNVRKSHIEVASKLDNVWLECSYAEHPRRVAEAVSAIGADRILFGSDCPFGNGDMAWDMTKVTAVPKVSNRQEKDTRRERGQAAAHLTRDQSAIHIIIHYCAITSLLLKSVTAKRGGGRAWSNATGSGPVTLVVAWVQIPSPAFIFLLKKRLPHV